MTFASPKRSSPGRPRSTGDPGLVLTSIAVVVLAAFAVIVTVAARIAGTASSWNPFSVALQVLLGKVPWTWAMSAVAVVEVVILAGVAVGVTRWRLRHRKLPIDSVAPLLGHGREIAPLSEKGARAIAQRLRIADDVAPGLRIGTAVVRGTRLWQNWEQCSVDVWGPRRGKTSTQAIPAIQDCPGPVLATTNKYDDLLKATRAFRERMGTVYVFDIQQVAGERPTWWWNPLTYVIDDATAENLTEVFSAGASKGASGSSSDFFVKAARRLLTALLIAGARADKPITIVLEWLTDHKRCSEAEAILREHDRPELAEQVYQQMHAPDKQRGGVYETAANWVASFGTDTVVPWITDPGDGRPHLDVHEFVRGPNTLYCLSRESGSASAAQIVAALVQAVCDAAEAHASRSGGRLPLPMAGVLDECANVVRWPRLPEVYSYYGSQGICLKSYFQSFEQGVNAFGREKMDMLWDSANIRIVGGGTASTRFLDDLVKLGGRYTYRSGSRSYSDKGGGSLSQQTQTEAILDVSDLAALPRGRALLFAAGSPPVLFKTHTWDEGPRGDELKAAIADAERRALTLEPLP
ncbi:conjugal transfer protein [Skermania sp. ID1734]|uniref:type IV secretory system conjugative DNA transfer family protein n=1 Tax=Skermania sp. ID1734 TaxID=2597516 RepID=UPI0011809EF7|nr:type IV secretory system conjugative DNA transfer family protein [Skermania sp. ID1734]TSD94834.1 conjugal transfer protein [Skermania sp. ID1734]